VTLGAWSTACDLIFAFMRPSQHSSNEPVSAMGERRKQGTPG
jgi:hypothetical protein